MSRDRHRWSDIGEMAPADKQQVLQTALSVASTLKLSAATLSIHRGSWVNTKHFHCHVCTDVPRYLHVFQEQSRKPPMSSWWPSDRFVNKQWKAAKDKTRYADNVRGYPYGSYKAEEVKDIERTRARGPGLSTFREHPIVFHEKERRIGVAGPFGFDVAGLYAVLELLEALKTELGVVEGQKGGPGCHVCLDLSGTGFPGFKTDKPVQGYLQVTGPMMYQTCPPGVRDTWFANYKNPGFQDKVYT